MHHKINMMLDSGAFSIWRRGSLELEKPEHLRTPIVILREEYRDALKYLGNTIFVGINLDVIPGELGRDPTGNEVEDAASQSWDNYEFLRDSGCNVMPVFHYGESFEWLDQMVKSGATYIGLGAIARVRTQEREVWLDKVFGMLCGDSGLPCVKVHGLGVTSLRIMQRYPWYSVDSTTAQVVSSHGGVMLPIVDKVTGRSTFLETAIRSLSSKGASEECYATMPPASRAVVDAYLAEQGFTIQELAESPYIRFRANVRFFSLFLDEYVPQPFHAQTCGFFAPKPITVSKRNPLDKVRIFYGLDSRHREVMLDAELCMDRLMSFVKVRDTAKLQKFKQEIETGLVTDDDLRPCEAGRGA